MAVSNWTPKKIAALRRRVAGWLEVDTQGAPVHGEALTSIELQHVDAEGNDKGPPVIRWFQNHFGDIDALVRSIIDMATHDAQQWGGKQRYRLYARFGAGGAIGETAKIEVFTKRDDDDAELTDHAPSEAPNEKGITAQLMRHMEQRDRTYTNAVNMVLDKLVTENQRLSDQVDRYEKSRVSMIETQERLLSQEETRKQDAKDREAKRKLWEEGMKLAKLVAPILGNYLAGDKIFPEVMPPEQMAMAAFFDSLESEQWRGMLSCLNGPQQMFANHLLKMHLDAKDKREGTFQGDRALPENTAPAPTGTNGAH